MAIKTEIEKGQNREAHQGIINKEEDQLVITVMIAKEDSTTLVGTIKEMGTIKEFGAKIEGQIIKGIGAVVHKEMGAKTGLTDAKEVVPGSQVPQLDYEDV